MYEEGAYWYSMECTKDNLLNFKIFSYVSMLVLAELGTCDNLSENATMSRSRKIVACRVIAKYSKIVALSLSQIKIVANFRDIRETN